MSRPLTVALLQLQAFDLDQHAVAWDDLLHRIDEAATLDPHPDLVVLPEASYPAYFLHSRTAYNAAGVLPDREVHATLAARAALHQFAIAAGLVRTAPTADGESRLENAAVLFNPDGTSEYTTKSFLWHFDSTWFAPGTRYPVFDLAGTRAGMLVCADARLPEISRALAVGGAELIIDSTAWVSSGRDATTLSSPQVDYLIPARAIENGTWIVAADKCGVEADTLVYAGRSGVCDPRGHWVAQAPADRPGIVLHTLDLDDTAAPRVVRRPELYRDAATAGQDTKAAVLAREPLAMDGSATRAAAVAMDADPSVADLVNRIRGLVRTLSAQGTRIVVLPDFAGNDPRAISQQELLPLLTAISADTDTLLTTVLAERMPTGTYKTQTLVGSGRILASHRQTHLTVAETSAGFTAGDEIAPIVETAFGNIGLMAGCEGLVPEVARGLKLRGAEFLLWSAGNIDAPLRILARARANEERAYVVAAGGTHVDGGGYVIDPSGAVIGETLAGQAMAMSADMHRMFARWNDMAPGTNPVHDRYPEAFALLFA